MSDARPEELTLQPGRVWTAQGTFAVDALKVRLQWNPVQDAEPALLTATIVEIHELNVLARRNRAEMRLAVRRAISELIREGLCFWHNDEVYRLTPGRVRLDANLRIRVFVLDDHQSGPFTPADTWTPDE